MIERGHFMAEGGMQPKGRHLDRGGNLGCTKVVRLAWSDRRQRT